MDFVSDYVLEEEEEEELKPVPYSYSGGQAEACLMLMDDDYGGFECEIMDFDNGNVQNETPRDQSKKVSTNTASLTMSALTEKSDKVVSMAKPVTCQNPMCRAALSHIDKLTDGENGKKLWTCQFCGMGNQADLCPELAEAEEDVLYVEDTNHMPDMNKKVKDYKIIFAIDTSASMSQTLEVELGKLGDELRQIWREDLQKYLTMMQLMNGGNLLSEIPQDPNERVSVSRLQAVKAAIITQLKKLKEHHPQKRVGLVVFNDRVEIFGDGRRSEVISGDKLDDFVELLMAADRYGDLAPISESADKLIDKIRHLKDDGRTALGPALTVAGGMVQSVQGSKVILCTDGLANVGVGRLEDNTQAQIDDFYDSIIAKGKASSFSVSLISFDNCGLNTKLGLVPYETGGIVERIQPIETEKHLEEELVRETMATLARIQFVVHKDLYVKDPHNKESRRSCYSHLIGNIQVDKKVPFSFGFKSDSSKDQQQNQQHQNQLPPEVPCDIERCQQQNHEHVQYHRGHQEHEQMQPSSSVDPHQTELKSALAPSAPASVAAGADQEVEKREFPFQVHISYQDMSGVKGYRVWTSVKPVTKSRDQAEKAMNYDTAVTAFLQDSATKLTNIAAIKNGDPTLDAYEFKKQADTFMQKPEIKSNVEKCRLLTKYVTVMEKIIYNHRIEDSQMNELLHFKDCRA